MVVVSKGGPISCFHFVHELRLAEKLANVDAMIDSLIILINRLIPNFIVIGPIHQSIEIEIEKANNHIFDFSNGIDGANDKTQPFASDN